MITLGKLIDNGLLKHANQIRNINFFNQPVLYWDINNNVLVLEYIEGRFYRFDLGSSIEFDNEHIKIRDSRGIEHVLAFDSVSSVNPQKYLLTEQEQLANL